MGLCFGAPANSRIRRPSYDSSYLYHDSTGLTPVGRTVSTLLIVRPQCDFMENGSHPARGTGRAMWHIQGTIAEFDNVVVALEQRQPMHITHGVFWVNPDGDHPPPGTVICLQDVYDKKWVPSEQRYNEGAQITLMCMNSPITIQPEHCIIGTHGACVVPGVSSALNKWCVSRKRSVTYVALSAGTNNPQTSLLHPRPMLSEDISFNHALLDILEHSSVVLVAGDAYATALDLLDHIKPDCVAVMDSCTFSHDLDSDVQSMRTKLRIAGATFTNAVTSVSVV